MKKLLYLITCLTFFSFNQKANAQLQSPDYLSQAYGINTRNTTVCRSTNGQYRLIFQGDANLVLVNAANKVLWSSQVLSDDPNATCIFSVDGKLTISAYGRIIYQRGGSRLLNPENPWTPTVRPIIANSDPYPFRWVLQDDGNLVCYYSTFSISTRTDGGIVSKHNHDIR